MRALIWIDGRLIVVRPSDRECGELSLPGGRVSARESVLDALRREVAVTTGLDVTPGRLVYVCDVADSSRAHDLELIFLAEPNGVPRLNEIWTIDLAAGERPAVRPSLLDLLVSDAATGWRENPRWLVNRADGSAEGL